MEPPNDLKLIVNEKNNETSKESKESGCCGPACCGNSNDKKNNDGKEK